MIGLSSLISHRFRGFAPLENTLEGFVAALDFGVLNLEFDIRVTRCGTPMIYHDEFALDKAGKRHEISELMASDFKGLGGTFASIPTAEALFKIAGTHANTDAKFFIDIKDAGFETEIHALVCLNRLEDRVVYVSWVPNALYAIHALAADASLCLSHWCQDPPLIAREVHEVFEAPDGLVPRLDRDYIHGERSGWYIKGGVQGELRDMLRRTKGSVCVPQFMVTRDLVDAYHADGIEVSTFSYVTWPDIRAHEKEFNIDLYFIDNKRVFDEL